MNEFRLSPKAQADVEALTEYGIERFGEQAGSSYLTGLFDLASKLAVNPKLGVAARSRHNTLRRHPYRQHVIFYEAVATGIYVFRVVPMARLQNPDRLPD